MDATIDGTKEARMHPLPQRHQIPEPDAPDGDDDEDVVDELDRWD
jgi:hypothetical protein